MMKIYPHLRALWLTLALTTLASTGVAALAMLDVLTEPRLLAVLTNAIELIGSAALAVVLYRLSDESTLFARALRTRMLSLALLIVAVATDLLVRQPSLTLFRFVSLLTMTGGLIELFSEFFLYWGLDERIIPFCYAYPARRIRWCLYGPLLGSFLASMVLTTLLLDLEQRRPPIDPYRYALLVELACRFIPLALLGRYNKAVRAREDDPLTF